MPLAPGWEPLGRLQWRRCDSRIPPRAVSTFLLTGPQPCPRARPHFENERRVAPARFPVAAIGNRAALLWRNEQLNNTYF